MNILNVMLACMSLFAMSLQAVIPPPPPCVEGTHCTAQRPPSMVARKGMCIQGHCKAPGDSCFIVGVAADRPVKGTYAWVGNTLECQATAT